MRTCTGPLASMVLSVVLLVPAAFGAQAHPATGAAEDVVVPLRVEAGHLIVPVVAADGTSLDFILSTGTPPVLLAESAAVRLGENPELTLGGLPVSMTGSQTLPDERLRSGEVVFDGMIGPDTLNQFDVLIDAPGGRLVLRPIGPPADWDGVALGDPIAIRVFHGQILAHEADLNGTTYLASLDLGLTFTMINPAVAEQLGLESVDSADLEFAGAAVADTSVRVYDNALTQRWDPDGNGVVIVGAPIAHDCAMAISYVRSEIRMCVR